jgi:hypothetical protein
MNCSLLLVCRYKQLLPLSTATDKMLIKYFGNIFWLKKIISNIV